MSRWRSSLSAISVPRNGAERRSLAIGLMGGSFNPAHAGHRHIAVAALKRLALDEIWWLVSPQNPLKTTTNMASLHQRIASAKAVARHPRIKVVDIESRLGSQYTADLLSWLSQRSPKARFVWIMGADNLQQFHAWARWSQILHTMPVAIFDRPPYSLKAINGKVARRFRRFQVAERRARRLSRMVPPAWVFLHTVRHPAAATAIRARQKDKRVGDVVVTGDA